MTQHFGSSFVQDLLSSTGGAPASVSPVIRALSTQSYSAGLDVVCPKLTLSDSSSSIQRDATTVIPQVTPSGNGSFSPTPCSTASSTMSTSTSHQYGLASMANAKWLAEEKTPKHLRRKNIMYRDKLNVLLPKQNTLSIIAATNVTYSKQQHPMVSKNSTTTCTSGHTSTTDGIANTCNVVANPILM